MLKTILKEHFRDYFSVKKYNPRLSIENHFPPQMPELIVIKTDFDRFDEWRAEFDRYDIEAIHWKSRHARIEEIRYALVWEPESGSLARIPNLGVVFSVGAGIDHLKGDNLVPDNVPVVRMVEDSLTTGMVEFVLLNVLRFHRNLPFYADAQQRGDWNQQLQKPATERTVGILGLGVLGTAAGEALRSLGFNVVGWSRSEKEITGIKSYFGTVGLDAFLAQTEFLVCLLPHTDATANIVDANLLAKLPAGAWFINGGRGGSVVESDLIAALESGQLAGAALDVFQQEPLPSSHPLWRHPKVLITPHIASMTLPHTSAAHVAANITRFRQGKELTHLADLSRGY